MIIDLINKRDSWIQIPLALLVLFSNKVHSIAKELSFRKISQLSIMPCKVVRLSQPSNTHSHSRGRIEEIGWIIHPFNGKESAIVGAIRCLLSIWLVEVGLFEMREHISLGR